MGSDARLCAQELDRKAQEAVAAKATAEADLARVKAKGSNIQRKVLGASPCRSVVGH